MWWDRRAVERGKGRRLLPLIRPSGTFSHEEAREKAIVILAFSRFFQREKVADRPDEGPLASV